MDTPDRTEFRLVTSVRTTPERLWQALREPTLTTRWWQGVVLDSDWTPGAPVTWYLQGTPIVHPDQVVLEADPPRHLAFTWHTFTPEWAAIVGFDEEQRAELAAEPRSTVTFDLEPRGDLVELTVIHGDLLADGRILPLVSVGWPRLVADLASLVEAGGVGGAPTP